jgi:pimeloyl-ACP methyl ester carboxylesterase
MKQKFLYKGNFQFSYTDYGKAGGYPVLVQHGLIASIEDYDLFEGLIKLGVRLISIARPGYGESSPYPMQNVAEWGEIVYELVHLLKLSQFDVLGMSSGAPYSYSIGYKFPQMARNIFIFSGIPALYDEAVANHWPYELKKNANIEEMEKLARQLFFSGLSQQDLARHDIQDSMKHNCFGIALDFRIRCMDWGFDLSKVQQNVFMQHSRLDEGFIPAEITSKMMSNCRFLVRESEGHFSKELLDEYIQTTMAAFYRPG